MLTIPRGSLIVPFIESTVQRRVLPRRHFRKVPRAQNMLFFGKSLSSFVRIQRNPQHERSGRCPKPVSGVRGSSQPERGRAHHSRLDCCKKYGRNTLGFRVGLSGNTERRSRVPLIVFALFLRFHFLFPFFQGETLQRPRTYA